MIPIIYPYKMASKSAKLLAEELGTKRVFSERYKYKENHLIINWGNTRSPGWLEGKARNTAFNLPCFVKRAVNKLDTFGAFKVFNVPSPEYTTDYATALALQASGKPVVARSLLSSYGGRGMIIYGPTEALPEPHVNSDKLWVEYIKKYSEYRVHVLLGEVIATQQKRKRKGVEHNGQIRNLANGWVFTRSNIDPDQRRDSYATSAVASLGLDFGAVDIIYNQHRDQYYVLEVNTAPGLEGQTLLDYTKAIKEVCHAR